MSRATKLAILLSILAVMARLIWIDQPFSDNWSWRQSDVAAIARNYSAGGFHFARPQIDWAGDQPGYVGTEFPILPFVAAICYKAVGVHEWVGRAQAVILFAVSLPFFFFLVREIFGDLAASWALFFYGFTPLNLFAGRTFIPDVPSLGLGIIGLYFFFRWIESELATGRVRPIGGPDGRTRSTSFFFSALAISLSILIKAPSAIIGAPLACLALQRFRYSVFRRLDLWIFAAIVLVPSAVWYWHAYQIATQFYPYHFFGAGGIRIMHASWYSKIAREIATSTLTPIVLLLAIFGAFVARSTMRARFFYWWLVAMILFIIVVGYGNRHQWYQLPLVPIAAAFAGAACAFFARRISRTVALALSILLVIAFGLLVFHYVRPFYFSHASVALRSLGLELKATTPQNALIVAADNGDPTVFYYAERKGWHFLERDGIVIGDPLDSAQAIIDLEELHHRGATYLVLTWATRWWLDYYKEFAQHLQANSKLVKETPEFIIYRLDPVTE
jgi:4-amino-4-deoxy-L-arabinose transferase-like glycosyltransferase